MEPITEKSTWWFFSGVTRRLETFAQAMLERAARIHFVESSSLTGRIELHPDGADVITISPLRFKDQPVAKQFELVKAVIAHEVGHSLFTSYLALETPFGCTHLKWLVNALEDQRVERGMVMLYPMLAESFRSTAAFFLDQAMKEFHKTSCTNDQALMNACLFYRWASQTGCAEDAFEKSCLPAEAVPVWEQQVRPRVLKAWEAKNTEEVHEIACEILGVLGITPRGNRYENPILGSDLPSRPAKSPPRHSSGAGRLQLPGSAAEDQPVNPAALVNVEREARENAGQLTQDRFSRPAAFRQLEEQVQFAVRRLSEQLALPAPDVLKTPHAWRGRYTFRQMVRTPDKPFLSREVTGRAPHSLALYILVDRSGSMDIREIGQNVRTALMTVYLAAVRNGIPTGIAFFGGNAPTPPFEVTPPSLLETEAVKANIAGFQGTTSAEFVWLALELAEKRLAGSNKKHKLVLVIHDGEPVYVGEEGRDWDLSIFQLKRMRSMGLHVTGLFLEEKGSGASQEAEKLAQLFGPSSLVICSPGDLPERLGRILSNMV